MTGNSNQPSVPGAGRAVDAYEEAALRLKELEFTDLFFSEKGEAFIRGLEDADGPLAGVPAEAVEDLDELHRRVCERGQREAEFFMDYDGMRFRVSRIEDVDGVWYTLRRAKWPIPRLHELGLPSRLVQYLGFLGKPPRHGLLLIAGKTGEGKTTTACSLLQEYLIHYGDVAVTIEDPIELPLNGAHGNFGHCFQTQVTNGDFAGAMKKTMRRSPRYILLGEVRGSHEASQAIKAATNGHLVITTIHAGSVTEAIQALLKFVAGEEDIELARSILADGMAGVLHQELVKRRDRPGRFIKPQFFFPGDEKGIRTKIRQGKIEQLSSDIDQQMTRVMQGKSPTGE
jgi:twitching motility protein PilT